jgi:hypothetical protein
MRVNELTKIDHAPCIFDKYLGKNIITDSLSICRRLRIREINRIDVGGFLLTLTIVLHSAR